MQCLSPTEGNPQGELLPTASPWLLGDCTGSGHPIRIGAPLSNRPGQLGSYHMDSCQGQVAHHYWALVTNITDLQPPELNKRPSAKCYADHQESGALHDLKGGKQEQSQFAAC